jgi:hypothetical protein
VRFADPAALFAGEDDGDDMAGFDEVVDEGVDVGGALVAGGAVVVDYLAGLSATPHSVMDGKNWKGGKPTRMCIFADSGFFGDKLFSPAKLRRFRVYFVLQILYGWLSS